MLSIGHRIKERRKELGISVDDLATAIGKDRATVYRYENSDIKKLPTTVLEPLAAALDVSPAWLMGYDDAPAAPLPNGNNPLPKGSATLSQDESLVLSKYRRLSPDGKEYIHDQLNFRLDKEAADEKKETHTA